MKNVKVEKQKDKKEEYIIKDIFAKDSNIDINEILKKSFLINLNTNNL